jgi:phospholipase/carboxylesterase
MNCPRFSQHLWSHRPSPATKLSANAPQRQLSQCESSTAAVILPFESAATRGAVASRRRPVRPCSVFVPENYEPNYAYPLIVWLHETGASERDIARVLPRISLRNYLGLSLRGTAGCRRRIPAVPGASAGYGWSRSLRAGELLQDELQCRVRGLRREFHVNAERVFLAGAGDGGTAAWELFLARPEWFAGLAVLGGSLTRRRILPRRYHDLHGKHLLLSVDAQNPADRAQAEQAGRLMHSAGLAVSFRSHRPGRPLSQPMLRQVDRWIMKAIGGCL